MCYNHTGSSGAMKVVGMNRIFHCSERLHNLRYTFCIGDDHTKSFEGISKSNPYPSHTVTKGECTGHVQNCVGFMSHVHVEDIAFKTSVTAAVIFIMMVIWNYFLCVKN